MIGNKQYWGKGIATEIVGLVSNYGFNRLNLNKLYAGVVDGNVGSSKALLNNGYKQYATVPQEYYLEGKILDVSMYYKLQSW
jgi:RimJ/RimL family protein N-acetyltransferase